MLVELVLVLDGRQYWRLRRHLPAVPDPGAVLQILGELELDAAVTGSTWPLVGGQDRPAAAAVLIHASTRSQEGVDVGLRREGWHQLL